MFNENKCLLWKWPMWHEWRQWSVPVSDQDLELRIYSTSDFLFSGFVAQTHDSNGRFMATFDGTLDFDSKQCWTPMSGIGIYYCIVSVSNCSSYNSAYGEYQSNRKELYRINNNKYAIWYWFSKLKSRFWKHMSWHWLYWRNSLWYTIRHKSMLK